MALQRTLQQVLGVVHSSRGKRHAREQGNDKAGLLLLLLLLSINTEHDTKGNHAVGRLCTYAYTSTARPRR